MTKEVVRLIVRLAKLSMLSFPATKLPLHVQIERLKSCVRDLFYEDETISLNLFQPFFRILHRDVGYKLLRNVLKRWPAMVKAKNLMLLARVEEQKQELEKARAQSEKYFEELLHVQDRNGHLSSELEAMEKSKLVVVNRVEAYGEGLQLKKVTDKRLESIGVMIGVARERWRREHVIREVEKTLSANPYFLCPITKQILVYPVVASDGYTYERDALVNLINFYGGKSPMTRQPISILRHDDALKDNIDKTRARLESEIYDNCELPKL